MENLTIASLNVHNNYRKLNVELPHHLAQIIRENDIDVFCAQEMTMEYRDVLRKELDNYSFNGLARCGNSQQRGNELCAVITKLPKVSVKTKWLSDTPDIVGSRFFYSWCPRIMTSVITESGLEIINLHLDNILSYTRKRQLEVLSSILKEDLRKHRPRIITGDFNTLEYLADGGKTKFGNIKYFEDFKDEMKEYGLKHLEIRGGTIKFFGRERIVDHMFVPESWEVTSAELKDTEVSDHKMILTKVKMPY